MGDEEEQAEATHEDVFEAIDAWLDDSPDGAQDREYRVRRTYLGHVCTLYMRGSPCATAHARGSDRAIELALSNYKDRQ